MQMPRERACAKVANQDGHEEDDEWAKEKQNLTHSGEEKQPTVTRCHSIGEVPEQVKLIPTSLPELPKPSRTLEESQNLCFRKLNFM